MVSHIIQLIACLPAVFALDDALGQPQNEMQAMRARLNSLESEATRMRLELEAFERNTVAGDKSGPRDLETISYNVVNEMMRLGPDLVFELSVLVALGAIVYVVAQGSQFPKSQKKVSNNDGRDVYLPKRKSAMNVDHGPDVTPSVDVAPAVTPRFVVCQQAPMNYLDCPSLDVTIAPPPGLSAPTLSSPASAMCMEGSLRPPWSRNSRDAKRVLAKKEQALPTSAVVGCYQRETLLLARCHVENVEVDFPGVFTRSTHEITCDQDEQCLFKGNSADKAPEPSESSTILESGTEMGDDQNESNAQELACMEDVVESEQEESDAVLEEQPPALPLSPLFASEHDEDDQKESTVLPPPPPPLPITSPEEEKEEDVQPVEKSTPQQPVEQEHQQDGLLEKPPSAGTMRERKQKKASSSRRKGEHAIVGSEFEEPPFTKEASRGFSSIAFVKAFLSKGMPVFGVTADVSEEWQVDDLQHKAETSGKRRAQKQHKASAPKKEHVQKHKCGGSGPKAFGLTSLPRWPLGPSATIALIAATATVLGGRLHDHDIRTRQHKLQDMVTETRQKLEEKKEQLRQLQKKEAAAAHVPKTHQEVLDSLNAYLQESQELLTLLPSASDPVHGKIEGHRGDVAQLLEALKEVTADEFPQVEAHVASIFGHWMTVLANARHRAGLGGSCKA